jgi:hypothetical protein
VGDGLIEVKGIDVSSKSGTLKVTIKRPAGQGPTPPAAGPVDAKAYPIVIKTDDFKDTNPAKPDGQDQMEWTLKAGSLPSHKDKTGVLARLHNLGYGCDVDSDDTALGAAVTTFQRVFLNNDNPSGQYADIQQDLEDRHSNP